LLVTGVGHGEGDGNGLGEVSVTRKTGRGSALVSVCDESGQCPEYHAGERQRAEPSDGAAYSRNKIRFRKRSGAQS
jgi:hypothetical protein